MSFVRQTPMFIRSLLRPFSGRRECIHPEVVEAPGSFKTLVNDLPNPSEANLYH